MTFGVLRPLVLVALLFASVTPASLAAQQPAASREEGRATWPFVMTPRQHVAAAAFLGGMLVGTGGAVAGVVTAHATCPEQDKALFVCHRPTVLPEVGFSMSVGPGAYFSAAGAAVWEGCDPADARRRARRGALRGFVVGVAPLLAFHLAGGRDERVEWTLALAGSGYQVASITQATWGCLDGR